jgi:glutamyl-tRNA synthetase
LTTRTWSGIPSSRWNSIFDGLKWLDLEWDEFYRQSDRLELHGEMAKAILARGLAYRDFTPAAPGR